MKRWLLVAVIPLIFVGCGGISDGTGFSLFPDNGICINDSCTDGADGADGATGKSAYEIWLELGNEGSKADFIASLVGADGLSAYELAVEGGFEGSVEEWLASLIGPQGPRGPAGVDGNCSVCVPPLIPECPGLTPIPEGTILMTFRTNIAGLENFRVGHLLDLGLVLQEDGEIVEDNGTTTLEYAMPVDANGSHIIGIQFDK